MLAAMGTEFDGSYVRFVRQRSEQIRAQLAALPFSEGLRAHFEELALESLAAQERIEASDSLDFETYRQRYLDPHQMEV
jgi:glutamate--cysteine ligase